MVWVPKLACPSWRTKTSQRQRHFLSWDLRHCWACLGHPAALSYPLLFGLTVKPSLLFYIFTAHPFALQWRPRLFFQYHRLGASWKLSVRPDPRDFLCDSLTLILSD